MKHFFKPLIEEVNLSLSPVEIFQILKDEPHGFFLDSGMDPARLGRFSFLGSNPFLVFKSKGVHIQLTDAAGTRHITGNPLIVLKNILAEYPVSGDYEGIPFVGGAVGYFAYDLCHHIEKLPQTAIDDIGIPDCVLGFYNSAVIIDHLFDKTYVCSLGFPDKEKTNFEKNAERNLRLLKNKLFSGRAKENTESGSNIKPDIEPNFKKADYLEAILKAKEYISKGDIYQVNLSQRFSTKLTAEPFELYKRLRAINPAPFACYLDFGEPKVISASPERFLCLRDRIIHTRPIKGTRPRGRNFEEDKMLMRQLLDSPKDRAEHVMIVDLERNDLGRVCKFGSVRPTEFVILEKYSTVFHLVSTVSGQLRDGVDAVDCLLNCFPGGSITGAPKIRSIEIIDELEPTQRSIYTGSIGYISFNGNMDTSIVIRTMIAKGDKIYFQVGGGIVADSDPEAEYQETLDKAKALEDSLYVSRREILV